MKYKHVEVWPHKLQEMGTNNAIEPGVDLLEWYLNNQAPGRLVAMFCIPQPVPGSHLSPTGPRIEPVFHCVFELPAVIQ